MLQFNELKEYFGSIDLPKEEIRLSDSELIVNVAKFVDCHLIRIEANPTHKISIPFIERLNKLKNILEDENIH